MDRSISEIERRGVVEGGDWLSGLKDERESSMWMSYQEAAGGAQSTFTSDLHSFCVSDELKCMHERWD